MSSAPDDNGYRDRRTGAVYKSVVFNDLDVATVTTEAGAVFNVAVENLEVFGISDCTGALAEAIHFLTPGELLSRYDSEHYVTDLTKLLDAVGQAITTELRAVVPEKVADNIGSSISDTHWGKLMGYNAAIDDMKRRAKERGWEI